MAAPDGCPFGSGPTDAHLALVPLVPLVVVVVVCRMDVDETVVLLPC
jgi:hypothetical protein